MAFGPCDLCGAEPTTYLVGNVDTGQQTGFGAACFALVGMTAFLDGETAVIDAVLREKGYAPTKAERDKRKAETVPDYDPNRTIMAVTESAPTPPVPDPDVDSDPGPAVNDALAAIATQADDQGDAVQDGEHYGATEGGGSPFEADHADAPPY